MRSLVFVATAAFATALGITFCHDQNTVQVAQAPNNADTGLEKRYEANQRQEFLCQSTEDCILTAMVRLPSAPYPYDGLDPRGNANQKFFGHIDEDTGERVRETVTGAKYRESETYSDNRVLVHVPPAFSPTRPMRVVVYFHGFLSNLKRDVVKRHQIPRQVSESQRNAILVAPQMALNAFDPSPGKLLEEGGLRNLIDDVGNWLANQVDGLKWAVFRSSPIILIGFGGGYQAVNYSLSIGGVENQIIGTILLDAIFGKIDRILDWIKHNREKSFFVSFHSDHPGLRDSELENRLRNDGYWTVSSLPRKIKKGSLCLIHVSTRHYQVPINGPPRMPVTEVLSRIKW